ncbi:hypothetical protein FALBO_5818 [Fusarium albosuccineum]|uniref:Uncharacterized protein n=1 Tax=Fusarium albosuccineum TaxID=1237068 RepID=A0A8H4LG14_9HYPO|nr:hypothetical protein FALBO_5818 [Fusarium albosuccineum]
MTPESSKPAQPGDSETATPSSSWRSKQITSLKPVKTKTPTACDPGGEIPSSAESEANLPQPQFRQVAGHVSRRPNTSVRAEPPPLNPQRTAYSTLRVYHRKNRGGGGFGGDSDDSDSDDQKPNRSSNDYRVSNRRRRREVSYFAEPSDANLGLFEREEQERLDFRHKLQRASSMWKHMMPYRIQCKERAFERRHLLEKHALSQARVRSESHGSIQNLKSTSIYESQKGFSKYTTDIIKKQAYESLYSSYQSQIEKYDTKLGEYLGSFLYGKSAQSPGDSMLSLDRFLRQVEREAVSQCQGKVIPRCKVEFLPSDTMSFNDSLNLAIRCIHEDLGRFITTTKRVQPEDIQANTISENLDMCDSYMSHIGLPSGTTASDVFIETFLRKMIMCALNNLACSSEFVHRAGILYRLAKPRPQMWLESKYSQWLGAELVLEPIQNTPSGLIEDLEASQLVTPHSQGTRLVFIPHAPGSQYVSLVLFKDNQVLDIEYVSAEDLSKIGWYYDESRESYWRYEQKRGASGKAISKVDMDGDVFSVLNLDGQWLDWQDSEESMPRPDSEDNEMTAMRR